MHNNSAARRVGRGRTVQIVIFMSDFIENFNQAFGNLPKSLLYFSQDRIKKPSYF